MHSFRWGVLARGSVAAAAVLALAVAVTRSDPAAWLLTAILVAAGVALWLDQREAARLRRDLATGLSHHIRTPLTHIRMFNEMLLLGRNESEEERRHWLEIIEREAHRLGDLVENLLLVAHSRESQTLPARRPTDLGGLLEDVAASYAVNAAERQMRLVADPPAGVMALVDARALRQALVNLVANALHYGPEGQTVALTLRSDPSHVTLSVADAGPGVAPRDRRRIWKPFVRLGSPNGAESGTGLGLAVVSHVARAHGGRAYVEDVPGGGACFCIVLPVSAPPEPTSKPFLVGSRSST